MVVEGRSVIKISFSTNGLTWEVRGGGGRRDRGEETVGSKVLRKQDARRQRAATKEKKIIF